MSDETNDVQKKVEADAQFGESSNEPTASAAPPPPPEPQALAPNVDALSQIFKLNMDCLEELFVWMPLKDLFVLRQTCKHFKKRVDCFIKEFYPGVKLGYGKVEIDHANLEQFRYLDPGCCKLIKAMQMNAIDLGPAQVDNIKEILGHVEMLRLGNWEEREHDFHDVFLKFCTKFKSLTISEVAGNALMDAGNRWLLQHYSTLEHFVVDDAVDGYYDGEEIPQLKTFFQINPNIRSFGMSLNFLWENRNWLRDSDLHFDQLEIESFFIEEMDEKFDLLKDLHAQGFYKRLHFYGLVIDDYYMALISSVPGLEKVHLGDVSTDIAVPLSLKELNLFYGSEIPNAETLAQNMPSVERMYVRKAKSTDILPFISFSPNLQEIRVKHLEDGTHFENHIIDLAALSKERQQLAGAKKLTLYVDETIVLKMKWASVSTRRPLIEVKRNVECAKKPFSSFVSYIYPED